jgi:endo-1,3-1,4-beta-glycanase ExoK
MNSRNKMYLVLLLISTTSVIDAYSQDCNGAAIATKESFLYGRFETLMQSADGNGIVSSFFLYNIETNCNWPEENNEIDVEMTGNNQLIYLTTHHPDPFQTWYIGESFDLGFSPHDALHKYTMEWEPGVVRWFVDDELIYTQNEESTYNLQYPMAILMNLWAADVEAWVGEWDPAILPKQSIYDYVKYYRYTPGEGDAGTDNNFTLEWEDHFSFLDTARWNVDEFGGFGGNFCTFRQSNVQISDDDKLVFVIDEPDQNADLVSVSFAVNVEELNLSPTDVVYLNGTFNEWCGSCQPMIKNDNLWEISLNLEPGHHEYLFTINGWEVIGNAPLGSECDYNPCDEYANYGLLIPSGSAEINLGPHCWGQCPDCQGSTSTSNVSKEKKWEIINIYDALGRVVEERPGQLLFYLYDDGTVERKIIWFDN